MADTNRPFAAMTTSRDTINPLRPYYIPPSIGVPPPNTSTAAAAAQRTSGIGRSARDLLSDFDYTGQLLDTDGASFTELGRKLFDKAVWKYTSVLLAQPFDVAKTLLQLRLAGSGVDVAYAHNHGADRTRYPLTLSGSESEDDDDDDEPSYFTPTRPPNRSLRGEDETPTRRTRRRRRGDTASSATSIPASSTHRSQNDMTHRLDIRKPDSVMDVLSQLWQHSGATGLWKATNATFVYNVLAKAIEGFTRGLLCAILNLPDPTALAGGPSEFVASAMGAMNIADSPSPLASLAVSVAAVGITGVLLSPLDLVRTRLIVTPTTSSPRAILPLIRQLPSFTPNTTLLPITLLHSSLPTLITSTTPLVLRQYLRIDPVLTPSLYSLSSFAVSTAELLLKLPLETVLRRCQVHVLRQQHDHASKKLRYDTLNSSSSSPHTAFDTVVEVGPYKGIVGTMWSIARVEERDAGQASMASGAGTPLTASKGSVSRKADGIAGVPGLFRGWKVGMWGLVGVWGASALGDSSRGGAVGEF